MADKLVIYNPESNNGSHIPSDTIKGDVTIGGSINVRTLDVGTINLSSDYRFYWVSNSDKVYLEPRDQVSGNHQRYTFGSEHGLFIERNSTVNPNVIYCETKSSSSDKISQMGVQGTGDVWGDRWKNNGRTPYQNMLSEYIDTLTSGDLASGWTRLQNGLLLQWGTIQDPNNGSWGKITFPTAFTKVKSVHVAISDLWNSDSWVPVVYIDRSDLDLTGQGIICRMINGTAGPAIMKNWVANWFAIGY